MLGEPGHGKSTLCIKMVSDFCDRKIFSNKIKKVFSFSLNPTAWIKESKNSLDVKNIFILPDEQIMLNGEYKDIRLTKEHLEESLIFLDGYDELYLRLQESSKGTILFLKDLKKLAKSWNLKIIVTSRKTCINPSDLYKNKYRVCQLAKLTKDKQKDWINNVYNTELFPEYPYDTERIYNSFSDSKILELLEIPILLQLIVSKYFYGDAQNITELYDKLFEEILNTREEMTNGSFDENKNEEFKQIFKSYAYDIYKNNDTYAIIKSEELKKDENTKWKSLLLFYITSEKKQKEYYIEFVHRSFYQYFQAWYFYSLVFEIVKENKESSKKEKIANLFKSICWRKIEIDVINMIGQINQNQKEIQEQEQIKYILDIFEKTDGIIKGKEGEYCIPIGQVNILDRVETMMYNLLIILNIFLPNGLTISKYERIGTLIKKFDMNEIVLPNVILSNLNLDMVILKEANLTGAHLTGAHLTGAHLTGAHLEKADLERAHLERADLKWAHLAGANLAEADLKWADLAGANLTGANLIGAHLTGANLEMANLKWAHLEKAHLERADLKLADLKWTHLKRANLTMANLEKSDLRESDLGWANLRGANFKEANLGKLDLERTDLTGADLTGANLTEANLTGANLTEANLTGANLEMANLKLAHLEKAHLERADLKWADLKWADLAGADLAGANLTGANLTGANLTGANFNSVILENANLKEAKISRNWYNGIVALGIDVTSIDWYDKNTSQLNK